MKNDDQHQYPNTVQIRIEGKLESDWSQWFGNLAVSLEGGRGGRHVTVLTGVVPDQAALRGILNKLWDLNLVLISVNTVDPTMGRESDTITD